MANTNNRNQRKKNKGSGILGLVILMLIWGFNRLDSAAVSRFFARLGRAFRTGDFRLVGGKEFLLVLGAVLVLVLLVVTLTRIRKVRAAKRFDGVKSRGGGTAAAHSHDRITGYRGEESGSEHWKKQLDGFLEAGIIDRSEYKVLLERRRR